MAPPCVSAGTRAQGATPLQKEEKLKNLRSALRERQKQLALMGGSLPKLLGWSFFASYFPHLKHCAGHQVRMRRAILRDREKQARKRSKDPADGAGSSKDALLNDDANAIESEDKTFHRKSNISLGEISLSSLSSLDSGDETPVDSSELDDAAWADDAGTALALSQPAPTYYEAYDYEALQQNRGCCCRLVFNFCNIICDLLTCWGCCGCCCCDWRNNRMVSGTLVVTALVPAFFTVANYLGDLCTVYYQVAGVIVIAISGCFAVLSLVMWSWVVTRWLLTQYFRRRLGLGKRAAAAQKLLTARKTRELQAAAVAAPKSDE